MPTFDSEDGDYHFVWSRFGCAAMFRDVREDDRKRFVADVKFDGIPGGDKAFLPTPRASIQLEDVGGKSISDYAHRIAGLMNNSVMSTDIIRLLEVATGIVLAAVREERAEAERAAAKTSQHLSAGDWLLSDTAETPTFWGGVSAVLGAAGEALMIVGPDGVGKTTLAQQLALHRIGVLSGRLLGLNVDVSGRVLYLALDRPRQAQRSLRRMVSEEHREVLNERLTVWAGPLPVDVVTSPTALLEFVRGQGMQRGDLVVVDSLKDAVLALSEDRSGSGWNMARQAVLAAGIEMVELHHQRKEQSGKNATKPKRLADVYGSRWITGGAGSVVLLWGEPGDPVVEFVHLKQPAEAVGPFKVGHDHERGESTIVDRVDVLDLLQRAPSGLTAHDVARALFETDAPSAADIQRARRQLDRLVPNYARKVEATKGGDGGGQPARWLALVSSFGPIHAIHAASSHPREHPRSEPGLDSKAIHAPIHAPFAGEASTAPIHHPRLDENQIQNTIHASIHAIHTAEHPRFPPSLEGETAPGAAAPREEEAEEGATVEAGTSKVATPNKVATSSKIACPEHGPIPPDRRPLVCNACGWRP